MEMLLPSTAFYIGIVIFSVLVFIVQVLIVRWIFRINWQVALQQKQLEMLVLIALKLGAEKEVIEEIMKSK